MSAISKPVGGVQKGQLVEFIGDAPRGFEPVDSSGPSKFFEGGVKTALLPMRASEASALNTGGTFVYGVYGDYTIYAFNHASQLTAYVERVHNETGVVQQLTANPTQTAAGTGLFSPAGAVIGDYLYAVGGITGGTSATNVLRRMDLRATPGVWETMPAAPVAVGRAQVCAVGSNLYLIGGFNGGVGQAGIHKYSTTSNTWTANAGTLPVVVGDGSAVPLKDGRILVLLGYGDGYSIFDPATGLCTPLQTVSCGLAFTSNSGPAFRLADDAVVQMIHSSGAIIEINPETGVCSNTGRAIWLFWWAWRCSGHMPHRFIHQPPTNQIRWWPQARHYFDYAPVGARRTLAYKK